MNRFICVHGHFYQPPRENPWLEEVELQESAAPYHDWNERVTRESYAPNMASRVVEPGGMIVEIVNNYMKISFNFGPTLLSWMERRAPDVYHAILEADLTSKHRFSGHGSAIAQVYNHMIMPLANKRDKYTQAKWGIRDFEKRFRRLPEGMWLPETAVDSETLEILAELGVKFTVLSPYQASKIRRIGNTEWIDVTGGRVDSRRPYLCCLPSGKVLTIFFYDQSISHDVAFGDLLRSGDRFGKRLLDAAAHNDQGSLLVNIATDGETYGHHHHFGDMALAYCLHIIEVNREVNLVNYGEFLEKFAPEFEVEVLENTSWSCSHGVERWRSNCGCNTGSSPSWNQKWRRPLRDAMDWLRDQLIPLFEKEGSKYLKDPWLTRDDYIDIVLDRSRSNVEDFLSKHASKSLSKQEQSVVLKLLEMQRHVLLAYTSCGWFFDEISEIGTVQVMQYAARAIQLAGEIFGVDLEPGYLELLRKAPSNLAEFKNGADVFKRSVTPSAVTLEDVGVHYVISSLFERSESGVSKVYCYTVEDIGYDVFQSGNLRLVFGKSRISSDITWDETVIGFAVLWMGDQNVFGGFQRLNDDESLPVNSVELVADFERGDTGRLISSIDKAFAPNICSLEDLFKDEQHKIINRILQISLKDLDVNYRQIFESRYQIMRFLNDIGMNQPDVLAAAAEVTIGSEIRSILSSEEMNLDRLEKLVEDAKRFSVKVDGAVGLDASGRIVSELGKMMDVPYNVETLERVERLVGLMNKLPIQMDLWRAQNIFYLLAKQHYQQIKAKSSFADEELIRWIAAFKRLSEYLKIKVRL
jgi:alpha-amylase/alpha-mannosidase (GH57 family)